MPLFSTISFHSFSLLISSSSVSAITAKSSAYSSSYGRATLNSLDKKTQNETKIKKHIQCSHSKRLGNIVCTTVSNTPEHLSTDQLKWFHSHFVTCLLQNMNLSIPRPSNCNSWILTYTSQCLGVKSSKVFNH